MNRWTDRHKDVWMGRQTDRYIYRYRQTDRWTDRQMDRQMDRPTDRQMDRPTDRTRTDSLSFHLRSLFLKYVGLINVISTRASGFHRWTKLVELSFFIIRITFL